MENKVILISIDGMRPDRLIKCKNPYVDELKKMTSYTFDARTVFPAVTLPCHMLMLHSVPTERHGTITNTYMPQMQCLRIERLIILRLKSLILCFFIRLKHMKSTAIITNG